MLSLLQDCSLVGSSQYQQWSRSLCTILNTLQSELYTVTVYNMSPITFTRKQPAETRQPPSSEARLEIIFIANLDIQSKD